MRADDDHFGHYVPLLRRIIIVVAVLTAVPVMLWTITASVRTYVGPPKLPTFHPLAAAAPVETTEALSTTSAAAGQPPAATDQAKLSEAVSAAFKAAVEARDTASSPRTKLPGDRSPQADAGASGNAAKVAEATPAVAPGTEPRAADGATPVVAPDAAMSGTRASALQQPSAANAADTAPSGGPLAGAIPLPRHRPRLFAIAQTDVPVPRPRPDAAGAAPPADAASRALGWLRNVFRPQNP